MRTQVILKMGCALGEGMKEPCSRPVFSVPSDKQAMLLTSYV